MIVIRSKLLKVLEATACGCRDRPAKEEGDVKEGGEVGEELEGEHLDGEALLRGGKRSRFLCLRGEISSALHAVASRWQYSTD